MGLLGRRSVPLGAPRPTDLQFPDPLVWRKPRLRRQMEHVVKRAAELLDFAPEQFAPAATGMTDALCARVDPSPPRESRERIAMAFAIGMALAGVEDSAGWQRPGAIDAVIHTAMVTIEVSDREKREKETKRDRYERLTSHARYVGYWMQRTGGVMGRAFWTRC